MAAAMSTQPLSDILLLESPRLRKLISLPLAASSASEAMHASPTSFPPSRRFWRGVFLSLVVLSSVTNVAHPASPILRPHQCNLSGVVQPREQEPPALASMLATSTPSKATSNAGPAIHHTTYSSIHTSQASLELAFTPRSQSHGTVSSRLLTLAHACSRLLIGHTNIRPDGVNISRRATAAAVTPTSSLIAAAFSTAAATAIARRRRTSGRRLCH